MADTLVFLTPITANFIASDFQTREFQALKIEPYAKSFRHLSKLYVVDNKGNEASFVINDELLNNLQLQENEKLVIKGRNCIAGFVIDNINGVSRKK